MRTPRTIFPASRNASQIPANGIQTLSTSQNKLKAAELYAEKIKARKEVLTLQ
jgi:hypothetical protein